MSEQQILQTIVDRMRETFDVNRIVLFGSRARGEAKHDSDFDLLVEVESDGRYWDRICRAVDAALGIEEPKASNSLSAARPHFLALPRFGFFCARARSGEVIASYSPNRHSTLSRSSANGCERYSLSTATANA